MNNIQIFNNSEFGEVRTALIDNKPMFCLVDVCRVLEIKNPSDCKSRLKEPGVAITEVGVVTGTKKDGTESIQQVLMTFIDESNLYKVIFQSRKPQAE
jgi:antirepressor